MSIRPIIKNKYTSPDNNNTKFETPNIAKTTDKSKRQLQKAIVDVEKAPKPNVSVDDKNVKLQFFRIHSFNITRFVKTTILYFRIHVK